MKEISTETSYYPEWDDIKKLAMQISRKNFWRFGALGMDLHDAFQEAGAVFAEIRDKKTYQSKEHFVGYYVRSLTMRFHRLSNKNTRRAKYEYSAEQNILDLENEKFSTDAFDEVETMTSIMGAPIEIQRVVNLIRNMPIAFMLPLVGKEKKFFSDSRLKQMLGFPEDSSILNECREFFRDF